MAKTTIDEVEVLRFFETEPLEKATAVYNIIADKMRARLHGDRAESPLSAATPRRARNGKSPAAQQAGSHADAKPDAATD